MRDWVVGVDLGATKIALGLIDPADRVVARRRTPTQAADGPEAVVERIAQSVLELHSELPTGKRIAALGICTPGPVDHETGTLLDPPNLPELHNAPLRDMLSDRLDLPVRLEHDAKAAALGEFHYGAGRGQQSMVYIVLGTGVGGAIIMDGQLYRGTHNSAGEVGHITLDRHGDPCSCGCRGCVETYVSGPALARRYLRALEHTQADVGHACSVTEKAGQHKTMAVSGEQVAHLARCGDALATQVLAEAGEALGIAVASMAMILDIELYVVGSSVARAGELLLVPAREAVPHHCFGSVSRRLRIVTTELWDDGPILGCGWLARHK
jgi:glucokinase